jgi:hypothetical protein
MQRNCLLEESSNTTLWIDTGDLPTFVGGVGVGDRPSISAGKVFAGEDLPELDSENKRFEVLAKGGLEVSEDAREEEEEELEDEEE